MAHQAVFSIDGQRVTLLPLSVGEAEVFFVFRDRTSGRETYGAGRFLTAALLPFRPWAVVGPPPPPELLPLIRRR